MLFLIFFLALLDFIVLSSKATASLLATSLGLNLRTIVSETPGMQFMLLEHGVLYSAIGVPGILSMPKRCQNLEKPNLTV